MTENKNKCNGCCMKENNCAHNKPNNEMNSYHGSGMKDYFIKFRVSSMLFLAAIVMCVLFDKLLS